MIGVALAGWLLDQHPHDGRGDALGREAEQLEQLSRRGGLAEALDSDDGSRAPDVLVPEVATRRSNAAAARVLRWDTPRDTD
jgi:hypothetical protein